MALFPIIQTADRIINQLQQNIAQALRPILTNPICLGETIQNISLSPGSNTVNHGLGRKLQGWIVVGKNAGANIYDRQATNPAPDGTLILVSDIAVTVNLYCY